MSGRIYSQRLGAISDDQFQAELARFGLGRFVGAEAIPFGVFGQNVFVTSTEGEFVLRGKPHFWWQFPVEQFHARQLSERTTVPVPWPYWVDPSEDIFGWSYAIMPRLPGLQLANPKVRGQLGREERRGIAQALGENLAGMHQLTWPFSGRYNAATQAVEPLNLARELAWPFPVESDPDLGAVPPTIITYSERVKALVRHILRRAQEHNDSTTSADVAWVEGMIAEAEDALDEPFQPCFVMADYKEGNLVVSREGGSWRVGGVFDLMEGHFGDGEADLARPIAAYLDEEVELARAFLQAYARQKPLRPGFARRFAVYALLDRAIIWEFGQRPGRRWWDAETTFRDYASRYTSVDVIL